MPHVTKLFGWTAVTLFIAVCLWQLLTGTAQLPTIVAALLVLVTGSLIGIRVGYGSAARFVNHVMRLNRLLGEQNADLVERNHRLLKEISCQDGDVDPGQSTDIPDNGSKNPPTSEGVE